MTPIQATDTPVKRGRGRPRKDGATKSQLMKTAAEPITVAALGDDQMVTQKQLCRLLCISMASLHRWMNAGIWPRPTIIGLRAGGWTGRTVRAVLESKRNGTFVVGGV